MDLTRKKIVINLGIFGTHGIDRAAVSFIKNIPRDQFDIVIHQIYERDEVSFLVDELPPGIEIVTALPRSSFWGKAHMNRYKGVLHKLLDSLGVIAMQSLIAKSINALKPDIVYDYDSSLQKSIHLIESPAVAFIHFSPKRIRGGNKSRLKRMGKRLASYKHVVLLCDEMKAEALEIWSVAKSKFTVIPNPINHIEIISNSIAFDPTISNPQLKNGYIVNVARLTGQKDQATLLRAFKKAIDHGIKWSLVLVGDGDLRDTLVELAKELEIDQQVIFAGHQNNPYPWIKNAKLFALSSRDEGFGIALVEAMILNCPVISTACPVGPSDILGHGKYGLLSPVGDLDRMAENILQLYENKDLYEKNISCVSTGAKRYFSDEVSKQLLNLAS